MSFDLSVVQTAHELSQYVKENASQYHHSRPVAVSRCSLSLPNETRHEFDVVYGLKDLPLISAYTQSSLLMTGGTDIGKTTFAKLIMNGLLGPEEVGWHRIDVDLDFGADMYADKDFSVLKQGKKISEGFYSPVGFLKLPGLIADEINRTHAKIGNKLLHWFDKDMSMPDGSRVKLGYLYDGADTYQFQIAAINEGEEYKGTFEVDKALRRRMIIELPMDRFPLTDLDRRLMKEEGSKKIELRNKQNNIEKILEIYKAVEVIPFHPTAELFHAYLEAFDYCKHSPSGEKGEVPEKNGSRRHICDQPIEIGGQRVAGDAVMSCNLLKMFVNEMCPHVRALSPGVARNLSNVARGFALLRATKFVEMLSGYLAGEYEHNLSYRLTEPDTFTDSLQRYTGRITITGMDLARAAAEKYVRELEVQVADIESAVPFVGFSKLGLSFPWIAKAHQGSRFESINSFVSQAKGKFEEGLAIEQLADLKSILSGNAPESTIREIKEHCDFENPWLWKVLRTYLERDPAEVAGKRKLRVLQIYGH